MGSPVMTEAESKLNPSAEPLIIEKKKPLSNSTFIRHNANARISTGIFPKTPAVPDKYGAGNLIKNIYAGQPNTFLKSNQIPITNSRTNSYQSQTKQHNEFNNIGRKTTLEMA